ncbi:hypothetical protein CK203_011546 [Vitis vinifera]|uniref:Uncharacterized protein n=1 Tax=Vitis vinifera TaxID=29760 RepID=A0A438JUQ5_VITVI|nr:hypothetical protein CK203_011546 [Vitis vinifera]
MYQNDYQKFSASPPPSAPPYTSIQPEVATGIPIISTGNLQPGTEVVLRAGARALLLGGSLRLLIKEQLLCKLRRLRSTCMLCLSLLLLLPHQIEEAVHVERVLMWRLPCSLLLRDMFFVSGVRELTHRGFDMSLGWEGNMARQNIGVAMAPVVEGGMRR